MRGKRRTRAREKKKLVLYAHATSNLVSGCRASLVRFFFFFFFSFLVLRIERDAAGVLITARFAPQHVIVTIDGGTAPIVNFERGCLI